MSQDGSYPISPRGNHSEVVRTTASQRPKVAYLPFSTGTTTKPTQAQQGTATEGGTTLRYQNERLVNLNILVFTNALITSEHSFFIRSKTKDHHTTSVPVPFHPYLMAKCAPRKNPALQTRGLARPLHPTDQPTAWRSSAAINNVPWGEEGDHGGEPS